MFRGFLLGLMLVACGSGSPAPDEQQPIAAAGSSGSATSGGAPAGGAPASLVHAGTGGGGATTQGGSVGLGGAPAGGAGGAIGEAGSAGDTAVDPDCDPVAYQAEWPHQHAWPLKCQKKQSVDCEATINGGGCTGDGVCSDAAHAGLFCAPLAMDHSLCTDGFVAECPAGTCGTAAGSACDQAQHGSSPETICPCAIVGAITEPY